MTAEPAPEPEADDAALPVYIETSYDPEYLSEAQATELSDALSAELASWAADDEPGLDEEAEPEAG